MPSADRDDLGLLRRGGLRGQAEGSGENTWHFTWAQSEGSYEDQVFNRDAIEAARDDDYVLGTIHPNVTHVYMGVDPAISNWCSIVVWGLDQRTGQRYLIDDFNKKGMRAYIPYISDAILDLAAKYQPRSVVIESVSQQKSLHNKPGFPACHAQPRRTHRAICNRNRDRSAFGSGELRHLFRGRAVRSADGDLALRGIRR